MTLTGRLTLSEGNAPWLEPAICDASHPLAEACGTDSHRGVAEDRLKVWGETVKVLPIQKLVATIEGEASPKGTRPATSLEKGARKSSTR